MPTTKSHKFQSSREVFVKYIPNYKDNIANEQLTENEYESTQSGIKLAAELIEKMRKAIDKNQ